MKTHKKRRKQTNILQDQKNLHIPKIGQVTKGECDCILYLHGVPEDEDEWSRVVSMNFSAIRIDLEDIGTSHSSLLKSSQTWYNRIFQSFSKLPPSPPSTETPVIAENRFWSWMKWGFYHSGFISKFPYENLPIPKSLAIPSDSSIRAFGWHHYQSFVAIGLQNNSVKLMRISQHENTELMILTHEFQREIRCIEWKPFSGNTLAIGCKAGVLIWEGQWMTQYLQTPSVANITSIEWSPKELLLAVGCPHDSVVIWNVATGVPVRLHSVSLPSSYLLRWSPDGHYLFQASLNGSFTIWEAKTWTCERWTTPNRRVVQTACWSPDSHFLAFGLDGIAECYYLVFDHNVPHIGAHFYHHIPLNIHTHFHSEEDFERICGPISHVAWDSSGERFVVSFVNSNLIALFATGLGAGLNLQPIGFVRGPSDCDQLISMKFFPNFLKGALLGLCWNSNVLSFIPMCFAKSVTKDQSRRNLYAK